MLEFIVVIIQLCTVISEMILSCDHAKVTVVCKNTLLMTLLARQSRSNPMRALQLHVPKANNIYLLSLLYFLIQ
uniref:Secreted protein n=1 Tax=Trichogramma kaykai TaxID=54128 RepID=A0ABD2XNT9_9HYME